MVKVSFSGNSIRATHNKEMPKDHVQNAPSIFKDVFHGVLKVGKKVFQCKNNYINKIKILITN